MSGQTEQLKQKLEEMLASDDTEWANTVMVTLNAMYTQFQQEQQDGKQILPLGTRRISQPLGTRRISQPQLAVGCLRRSQDGSGLNITLMFVLPIV